MLPLFMRIRNTFPPNFLIPCFKLHVCRKLQACKFYIPTMELFRCSIVIEIICAVSELNSSVCSALACKYCYLCHGTLTFLVRHRTWLSSSLPSLSLTSSEMSSSSSGSYSPSESSNRYYSALHSASLKKISCSSSVSCMNCKWFGSCRISNNSFPFILSYL